MNEPKTWPEYARLIKAALSGLHVDARDVARRMRAKSEQAAAKRVARVKARLLKRVMQADLGGPYEYIDSTATYAYEPRLTGHAPVSFDAFIKAG